MKAFLLASIVLSICLMIEAVEHLHEGPANDLENQEVVYRVSRGLHGKKKGIFTVTGNLLNIR